MTDSSHKSNIWPEIPSEPVALLGFIFRISEIISLSLIVKWSNLLFVRNLSKGNTLLLITGLHCCEKYSLKYCAFSLQFGINKLFTRRGGILGALHLFITLFFFFYANHPLQGFRSHCSVRGYYSLLVATAGAEATTRTGRQHTHAHTHTHSTPNSTLYYLQT